MHRRGAGAKVTVRSGRPIEFLVVVVATVVMSAGWSGGPASGASTPSATSGATNLSVPVCRPPAGGMEGKATPVPGVPTDWNVTSFDGTQIRAHWFPVDLPGGARAPIVLMGPGVQL